MKKLFLKFKKGKNAMSLTTDFKIVWRESNYLPYIFATNDGDANATWDETKVLENIPNTLSLISKAIFGFTSLNNLPSIEKFGEITKKDERWFFINGISTDKQTFELNCNYLKELFGTQITGLYNHTHGLTLDLAECITGRVFDVREPFNIAYSTIIENAIKAGYKVKLIGHSQGGIIVSNIIRTLALKNINLSNLEVFTFASAADGEQAQPNLFQEHFANSEDFVSRIGLQSKEYLPKVLWKRADGKGHLLNRNYLNAFRAGKLCGGKSKLYSYLKK
jgi:hypothetical protein